LVVVLSQTCKCKHCLICFRMYYIFHFI